jgi:Tol biopolymer transport system component
VYTIGSDGTHLQQLTHLSPAGGVELGPFSPDGNWIVFVTSANATPWPNRERAWTDVFAIKTDGSELTQITRTKNWEGEPEWGANPRR